MISVEKVQSRPETNLFHSRDRYNAIFSLLLLVLVIWSSSIFPWNLPLGEIILIIITWIIAVSIGVMLSYLVKLVVSIYLPSAIAYILAIVTAIVMAVLPTAITVINNNPGTLYFSPAPGITISALILSLYFFTDHRNDVILYHIIPLLGLLVTGIFACFGPANPIVYITGIFVIFLLLYTVTKLSSKSEKDAIGNLEELVNRKKKIRLEDVPAKESDIKNNIENISSFIAGNHVVHSTAPDEIKEIFLEELIVNTLDPRTEMSKDEISEKTESLLDEILVMLDPRGVVTLFEKCALHPTVYGLLIEILAKKDTVKQEWLVNLKNMTEGTETTLPHVHKHGHGLKNLITDLSVNEQRLQEIICEIDDSTSRWSAKEENQRLSRELNLMTQNLDSKVWISDNLCRKCKREMITVGIHKLAPGFKLQFTFCQECQLGTSKWISPRRIVKLDHEIETTAVFSSGFRILRHPLYHLFFMDKYNRIFGVYDIHTNEIHPFPQDLEKTRILSFRDINMLKKHWNEIHITIKRVRKEKVSSLPVKPYHLRRTGIEYLRSAKDKSRSEDIHTAYEFAFRSNLFLAKALLTKIGILNESGKEKDWIIDYVSLLVENKALEGNNKESSVQHKSLSEKSDQIIKALTENEKINLMRKLPGIEAVELLIALAELANTILDE